MLESGVSAHSIQSVRLHHREHRSDGSGDAAEEQGLSGVELTHERVRSDVRVDRGHRAVVEGQPLTVCEHDDPLVRHIGSCLLPLAPLRNSLRRNARAGARIRDRCDRKYADDKGGTPEGEAR